jgi:tetratricopeptide (TPR) repeat protein
MTQRSLGTLVALLALASWHVAEAQQHQQAAPRRGGTRTATTEPTDTAGKADPSSTDKVIAELVAWKTKSAEAMLDEAPAELAGTAPFIAATGLLRFNTGKAQDALDLLRNASAADATDPMPEYFAGEVLAAQRKHDAASASWVKARNRARARVEADPKDGRSQYYLAAALIRLKQIGPARQALTKAGENGFDPRMCAFQKGQSHVQPAEWRDAKEAFDAVLELDPLFAPAYFYRGLTWSKLGRNDKMVEDLDQFIKLAPSSPDADAARAMLGAYAG